MLSSRGIVIVLSCALGIVPTTQTVPASGLIVGQVVDAESGRPVSGAIVSIAGPTLARSQSADSPAVPPRILTGADGYFVFRSLPPGSYGISAQKTGYADGAFGRRRPDGPMQQLVLQAGDRVADVSIRMWKRGAIDGTIVDEAGEPLVGLPVRCWRRTSLTLDRWVACGSMTATDDRGMYRLGGLTPGEHAVVAGGGGLSGRALVSSRPLPRPSRAPILYPATFYPSAREIGGASTITLGSGEERSAVDLQIQAVPTAVISGTVVWPSGSASRVVVRLWPAGSDRGGPPEDIQETGTESAGDFRFDSVAEGQYVIRATTEFSPVHMTRGWAELPVSVAAGGVEGVALVLQRGLTISGYAEFEGTLERPGPRELERLGINIEPVARDRVARLPTPSTANDIAGRFTSVGLPPGRYYVRVRDSPAGWMFKSAISNGRDVSSSFIELRNEDVTGVVVRFTDRWTSLSGTVQSGRGSADETASVLAFPTDASLWTEGGSNPRRLRSVRTDVAGAYTMRSLPSGDYYVIAVPDEQAADWQDPKFLEILARQATLVTVPDGEHKVQNLRTQEVR
jgi:protocatechuate 3,4-dioxygenase beta subunit